MTHIPGVIPRTAEVLLQESHPIALDIGPIPAGLPEDPTQFRFAEPEVATARKDDNNILRPDTIDRWPITGNDRFEPTVRVMGRCANLSLVYPVPHRTQQRR
ncbi:hypothetical protein EKI60_04050 [Candidatus Saccharibacteria bacterium]|nr:MAG: hypothetical protein EKI60_04050 [Candidatus Saccharibacteria bacterium]